MEKFAPILSLALIVFLLLRLLMVPLRGILRLGIHTGSGLICLWLLNAVSSTTGVLFPLNAVTVALAGFGGLPGIAVMALLTFIT